MTQIQIEMPDDVAAEFFRRAPDPGCRTRLLEEIFREYFREHEHEASDLALLNANADELNAEAEDALSYQVCLEQHSGRRSGQDCIPTQRDWARIRPPLGSGRPAW